MKRPGDDQPEPPGGRAAERLREFIEQRFPEGKSPEGSPLPAGGSEADEATGQGEDEPVPCGEESEDPEGG